MQIERSELVWRVFIVTFWIRALWVYCVETFVPALGPLETVMQLAVDMVIATLGIVTMRRRSDIVYAAVFVVTALVITCFYNHNSVAFFLNGMRDFLGFILVMPIYHYFSDNATRRARFIDRMDRHLLAFLIVQAVCITHQFLQYGAGDHGGGSLGNFQSGVITTLIYLISFYLAHKRMAGYSYVYGLWRNKWLIVLLAPTFLNETKVSFVFLAMYFVLLIPLNRRALVRMLVAIPLVLVLATVAFVTYSRVAGEQASGIFTMEYYTEMYLYNEDSERYAQFLLEEDNGTVEDVPRFTKIMLMGDIDDEHPGHALTGWGAGQFKGGTITEQSDFYKEYEWLLFGTVPYSVHMWVQLGFIGLALMVVFFVMNMRATHRSTPDMAIVVYLIITVLLIQFYNESLRNLFLMLVLNYVMVMSRHERTELTAPTSADDE